MSSNKFVYVFITEYCYRKRFHSKMDITGHIGRSIVSACGHTETVKNTADIMERWTQWNVAVSPNCPHTDTIER